ncbi:MAG: RdgB/HAM1 family non-canonical purine NTP pyrophosphatase [Sediminibacterium sp.]|jgi:XTP/dITP diphosphohydrolase|nr:RdgB/HAM1 family non-canonical purine NTP pyrophosphatase [Sediminibacterium sp.]MBP6056768.1 RdgB/HAM1 family non-canonical purine NTP pyrophosphatase [Candidatus Fonsibacter sp.]MBP6144677.1 RdgB/HAM1 family non-canonical purine NTP pyrophosphatase [Sediminibacterium sp.]
MHTLIFATNNRNKVAEIQSLVGNDFEIIPLKEAGIDIDIPEPHDQLEANATEKARTIFSMTHQNCFSEDTGLEIVSLGGAPGVKSARYAGEDRDFQANIDLVLSKMAGVEDRSAQFRTVICLIWDQKEYYFEGICKGQILTTMQGEKGFGYDPIFVPEGATKSFASMTMEEKNQYSHRQKAVTQLFEFLNSL